MHSLGMAQTLRKKPGNATPLDQRPTMTTCRACTSKNMLLVLSMGSHPPANAFLQPHQLREKELTFPLDMHVCLDCALIQVPNCIPTDYFKNYLYVPSAAETMHQHFRELAHALKKQLTSPDTMVVDIGCNDGVLLSALKNLGARTLGVDPAANLVAIARAKGLEVVEEYFSLATARHIRQRWGPAGIIVTTNTFNHIDDLHGFMAGVNILLQPDGMFVIEVPQAVDLIERNEFDTVYHEHLSEFSIRSLVELFRFFEMEIARLERLEIHGGSMRVTAKRTHDQRPTTHVVEEWIAKEKKAGLFSRTTYADFARRVQKNKAELLDTLTALKKQGKKIVGYGAPAKGNTLLNYYGIGTNVLEYLVDRNALKHGLYSPGMHIPIFPVEKIVRDQPDYLLLLAWNFAEEILAQQTAFRGRGGKFIVPIPTVKIL